jgi:hypothetical protein
MASPYGLCNPPGGIEKSLYIWSKGQPKEIDRAGLSRGGTIKELAQKISTDPDNGGMMRYFIAGID